MKKRILSHTVGTALSAVLALGIAATSSAPVQAQTNAVRPTSDIVISAGTGRLVRLNGTMSDLFVADPNIADVQVRSANQLYIFGKAPGETTIYATNKAGKVVYSSSVHVGSNTGSVGQFLRTAMPEARIQATPMNGVILLTGTVAKPEDAEEAARIVQAYVGPSSKIVSRIKTATPLQVMLRVRFAEVSRSLVKEVGVNLLSRDTTGGFLFGIGSGARSPGTITDMATTFPLMDASSLYNLPAGSIRLPFNPANGQFVTSPGTQYTFDKVLGKTVLGGAGSLFGLDILAALDLAEQDGRVATLAEPTLTALSGETASFLAGGEFPIPISQSLGSISVEYKQYGVGLAFTPTVLADGRISMRVRPEVSELSDQGSIRLNGFQVPALTTRRAETTVELGSGQSFVIGGLLRNSSNNSTDKAPWLGDLPVLGALFRSNSFRRSETELVIVVTPYLVKPVSDDQIALPTDGFRTATDFQRVILDQGHSSRTGERRPGAVMAPPQAVPALPGPSAGTFGPAPAPAPANQRAGAPSASPAPGFNF